MMGSPHSQYTTLGVATWSWERRMFLRDLEVFFFGCAMTKSPKEFFLKPVHSNRNLVLYLKIAENRKPWISLFLFAIAIAFIKVGSALGAKSFAIFFAKGLNRKCHYEMLPEEGTDVDFESFFGLFNGRFFIISVFCDLFELFELGGNIVLVVCRASVACN